MSKHKDEQDLQKFLKNVDEISNLIQGLNSADLSIQEKAIADSEKRLASTSVQDGTKRRPVVDRTVINPQAPGSSSQEETMNPEGFLAALEKDAKERLGRRKQNEALANALKEKGNDAFCKGDYALAVQNYTEGLKKQKDMAVLYTNRAQAYIRLQKFEKAIDDCNWALRCEEKCVKALFLLGKAYLAKKQFQQARECFLKILEADPAKEKLCKDGIQEVDSEEKRQLAEERALEDFQARKPPAMSVSQLLQKLSQPDQSCLYYAGGIQLLTEEIQGCSEQTWFRMNSGFSIINDNRIVRRILTTEMHCPAELELVLLLLQLWQAVCRGNEENQRLLLTHPDVNLQLPALLLSEVPEIQAQCMALLSLYAETKNGRILLVRHLDTTKWLQTLMSLVNVSDSRAACAMNLLTNLIMEEKFKIQCRIKLSTEVLPLFIHLLSAVKALNELALSQCIAILGDLCSDTVIQMQMTESPECWQACLRFVKECWSSRTVARYPECLHAMLGLMMNLSLEHNAIIEELSEDIAEICMALFAHKEGRIVTRAVGLLSHILPASLKTLEGAVKEGVVKKMIRFLKAGGEITSGYAMKVLATCLKSNRQAQVQMVKLDKKCLLLLTLLRSQNEVMAGNAAFCLGKCLEVPGSATNLLDTDVVRTLLRVTTANAEKTSVQENAAIALGKLCMADARHTGRLRELNGMAALSASMKYVKGL